jgi:hypothetical protein
MKELILKQTSPTGYQVHYGEDNPIGDFIMDHDGYYYFYLTNEHGTWSAHSLREMASKLDEINKPWDDYVKGYFRNKINKIILK